MNRTFVNIGNKEVGVNRPCYIVAEIGINHNGSMDIVRKLIDSAASAGCDAVKFQKRTVEVVYSPEELVRPRENPFGPTNGDLKRGLELKREDYAAIRDYCKIKGIDWFASCWDEGSVDFIASFDPPCFKIASASLTDDNLLKYHRRFKKPIILSTGMSTLDQIQHAVDVLGKEDLIIAHCTSTYPSKSEELNLRAIPAMYDRFGIPVGYSGHEVGLYTTYAARVLGACFVERHITLDRSMWGTDQAASVEPQGFRRLVSDIREFEVAQGDGEKRVYDSELAIIKKLRRIG